MKTKDIFLSVAEAVLWFIFLYFALFSVKNEVNIFQSALVLLITGYLAAWACPLVRHSEGWKKGWGKK